MTLPMETRFHESEVALLDSYMERHSLGSRENALIHAIRSQLDAILAGDKELPAPPTGAAWLLHRLGGVLPRLRRRRPDLTQTIVIADTYQGFAIDRLYAYKHLNRCRSEFATPRHALLAELLDEGVIEPFEGGLPRGFDGRCAVAVA